MQRKMKRHHIISLAVLACACMVCGAKAQDATGLKYRRSSIYTVLINHTDQKFASEIREAFLQMPVPDKYNDHDLSVKVLTLENKLKRASSSDENQTISDFLENNRVASRLVAKWFNRDFYTGECNMELVKERGLYNASEYDRILAEKSARSTALLMDAGEELIGNTFVLVNDIRYVDKEKVGKVTGGVLRGLGALASAYTGVSAFGDMAGNLGDMAETLKGFKVKVNTFLYQLVWNEETAMIFYKDQYTAKPDDRMFRNFEESRGAYRLRYVGKVESSGSTTSFMGVKLDEPIMMVRKACQRALDENVVNLQREFEEFRTKSPLVSAEPITAYVGMKEGVTKDSRFEVLEVVEREDGTREYKRVGTISPIENLIWDNRYMAEEEGAAAAFLGCTTFQKESGGDFFPGMLIREIKH